MVSRVPSMANLILRMRNAGVEPVAVSTNARKEAKREQLRNVRSVVMPLS